MKNCNICGSQIDDAAKFCTVCGSPQEQTAQPNAPVQDPSAYAPQNTAVNEDYKGDNGNILAGIIGAALFSLAGALLYFLIYQLGYIAGICGLVIFLLAKFGYKLFSKTKDPNCKAGIIIAVLITVVVIYLAEYASVSYAILDAVHEMGYTDATFADAIEATSAALEDPEAKGEFISELVMAYGFTLLACAGSIVSALKGKKKNK